MNDHGTDAGSADRLRALLSTLDRSERLLLLLHWADDLTPLEIGCVLDLPTAEVEGRLEALRARAEEALAPAAAAMPG